jgi:hypothetical protein
VLQKAHTVLLYYHKAQMMCTNQVLAFWSGSFGGLLVCL